MALPHLGYPNFTRQSFVPQQQIQINLVSHIIIKINPLLRSRIRSIIVYLITKAHYHLITYRNINIHIKVRK